MIYSLSNSSWLVKLRALRGHGRKSFSSSIADCPAR